VTLAPEALTGLLARWGVAPDAILPAERGTNNRTFAVLQGDRRWALRVSQNLSAPHPLRADIGDLCRELRAAGVSPDQVTLLDTAAGGMVAVPRGQRAAGPGRARRPGLIEPARRRAHRPGRRGA
jgi:hypothetical protein